MSESFIDSILSSVLAGIVLLFLIFVFFRPWVLIANTICETDSAYKFKIINCTLFKCTNLKVHLRKVTESDAFPKGKDLSYKLIDISSDSFIYIPSVISGVLNDGRLNCVQIKVEKSKENLRDIIKDNGTYLELIISTQHGMSNLQSTKKKTFKHINYLKEGKFKSGFSFQIVKNS